MNRIGATLLEDALTLGGVYKLLQKGDLDIGALFDAKFSPSP